MMVSIRSPSVFDTTLRVCSKVGRRCAQWLISTADAIDSRLTQDVHFSLEPDEICQRQRIKHIIREESPVHQCASSRVQYHNQLLENLSWSCDHDDIPVSATVQREWTTDAKGISNLETVVEQQVSVTPLTLVVPSADKRRKREETIAEVVSRCPASTWIAYLKLTGLNPKKAKPLYAALSPSQLRSLEQHVQCREALIRLSNYPCKLSPALKKQFGTLRAARESWSNSPEAKRPFHALIEQVAHRLDTELLSKNDRAQLVRDYNALLYLNRDHLPDMNAQHSRKQNVLLA